MPSYTVTCNSCGAINRIPADKQGRSGRCGTCHATLLPMYYQPQQLGDRTFDAFVTGYHGPILIEFWAPS